MMRFKGLVLIFFLAFLSGSALSASDAVEQRWVCAQMPDANNYTVLETIYLDVNQGRVGVLNQKSDEYVFVLDRRPKFEEALQGQVPAVAFGDETFAATTIEDESSFVRITLYFEGGDENTSRSLAVIAVYKESLGDLLGETELVKFWCYPGRND